jgi:hypothetical protein
MDFTGNGSKAAIAETVAEIRSVMKDCSNVVSVPVCRMVGDGS